MVHLLPVLFRREVLLAVVLLDLLILAAAWRWHREVALTEGQTWLVTDGTWQLLSEHCVQITPKERAPTQNITLGRRRAHHRSFAAQPPVGQTRLLSEISPVLLEA
jgi:hypothetical protein